MLDAMAGDVDDEAMVELAIALSLQDQQGDQQLGENLQQGLAGLQHGLQQLVNLGPNLEGLPALQAVAGMLGGAMGNIPDEDEEDEDDEEEEEEAVNAPQEEDEPNQQDPNHFSDTTASAPGSDDEGAGAGEGEAVGVGVGEGEDEVPASGEQAPPAAVPPGQEGTAAAAPAGSAASAGVEPDPSSAAGSESGASVIESLGGEQTLSSQTSAYDMEVPLREASSSSRDHLGGAPGEDATFVIPADEDESDTGQLRMHGLRLQVLDHLLVYLPRLRGAGGVRSIPFMQVMLMLTADLDPAGDEKDAAVLERLLEALLAELQSDESTERTSQRTKRREMQLVVLRLFSVLMSRSKSWQGAGGGLGKPPPPPSSSGGDTDSNLVSQRTAAALLKSGCLDHCLSILTDLLSYWRAAGVEESAAKVGSGLLRTQPLSSPPDMSPFFLKQYVKGHAHDVFEAYPQLLTEMALR